MVLWSKCTFKLKTNMHLIEMKYHGMVDVLICIEVTVCSFGEYITFVHICLWFISEKAASMHTLLLSRYWLTNAIFAICRRGVIQMNYKDCFKARNVFTCPAMLNLWFLKKNLLNENIWLSLFVFQNHINSYHSVSRCLSESGGHGHKLQR